jgi:hypothetical protein
VGGSKAKCCLAPVIALKLTRNIVISLPGIKALAMLHSCSGYAVDGSVEENLLPALLLEV